jgi:hypothetical protein
MIIGICGCLLFVQGASFSVTKAHTVSFGKWISIRVTEDGDEPKAIDLKVRALLVDGRMKEFTAGVPHDVTDRTFTVQRVYRLNDSLHRIQARSTGYGNVVVGCWSIASRARCKRSYCRHLIRMFPR